MTNIQRIYIYIYIHILQCLLAYVYDFCLVLGLMSCELVERLVCWLEVLYDVGFLYSSFIKIL